MTNPTPSLLSIFLYHHITGTIPAPSDWTTIGRWLELPYLFRPDRESIPLTETLIREIFCHSKITDKTDVCMFYLLINNLGNYLSKEQQDELLDYLNAVSITKLKEELKGELK